MNRLPLISPDWQAPEGVKAFASTRAGGVSKGAYASLNVGAHVGDEPDDVARNRLQLPDADRIHWLDQVHSTDVVTLPTRKRTADAAITRTRGHFCAVMTADCVPVLLCNRRGSEVAAIHAGWKGLKDGIIAATIAAMHTAPEDLIAWVGPAISAANYEVSQSLAQHFAAIPGVIHSLSADKALLDLPGIANWQLAQAGVAAVTASGLCTYADEQRFFSHRRATHRGLQATGRQVSVIGLT